MFGELYHCRFDFPVRESFGVQAGEQNGGVSQGLVGWMLCVGGCENFVFWVRLLGGCAKGRQTVLCTAENSEAAHALFGLAVSVSVSMMIVRFLCCCGCPVLRAVAAVPCAVCG
jgi:hypothetical protein